MFTQCPECHTVYKIKAKQLRNNRGIFRCKTCSTQFDALKLISEQAPKQKSYYASSSDFRSPREKSPDSASKRYWSIGVCAALLLAAAQFFYFEHRRLAQNPTFRLWLEKTCTTLHCRLPVYRNSDELDILNSTMQLRTDGNYRLHAAMINRAGFAQAYPPLKLTLLDFNGDSFAVRIFTPQEYLPEASEALFAAGASVEIGLDIATPEIPVGGFSIELL